MRRRGILFDWQNLPTMPDSRQPIELTWMSAKGHPAEDPPGHWLFEVARRPIFRDQRRTTTVSPGQPGTAGDKCRTFERGFKPPVADAPGSATLTLPALLRNAVRRPRRSSSAPSRGGIGTQYRQRIGGWPKKRAPVCSAVFSIMCIPPIFAFSRRGPIGIIESGLTKKDICFSLSIPV